jgi:deazaflavin-dependent oxidoreductase (nitroreductase family)
MLRQAKRRPIRLPRALSRLPLLVDRLGWHAVNGMATRVLGVEWIVLNTRGRRSGRPHTVMLDVVGYDAPRGIYYVQPAAGRRSDWVRNVTADPHVTVQVGTHHMRAVVRDATGPEGAAVVLRFLRAHPWYGRIIVWFVGYVDRIDRPDDELRRDLESTPVFAIEVAN